MTHLPLCDEIRDARHQAERAQAAGLALQRVMAAQISLEVVQRQVLRRPTLTLDVPGEAVIREATEAWSELADIASLQPHSGQPLVDQLEARSRQLDAIRQLLGPLASQLQHASDQLHRLQHEQNHLLDDPRYADALLELAAIGRARDEARDALAPLAAQLSAVAPTRNIVHIFTRELAWTTDIESDDTGVAAWRASCIAVRLLATLRQCLARTGFEIPIPADVSLPSGPDPAASAELLTWVETMKEEIAVIGGVLDHQAETLQRQVDGTQEAVDHHETALKERLG